jgi:hypothetical protein
MKYDSRDSHGEQLGYSNDDKAVSEAHGLTWFELSDTPAVRGSAMPTGFVVGSARTSGA